MHVVVLGGTRFIVRALVDQLLAAGHEPLVVHRGRHEPSGLPDVPHLHVDRALLPEREGDLRRFRPDAVIDLSAMTAADADPALQAAPPGVRLLVASSIDVYRAANAVWKGTVSDPVPLDERSPLRSEPPAEPGPPPPGWDFDPRRYEKLDVERAYLGRGATVCRLPLVYGEHDYKLREDFVLRRVRAGRCRIPLGAGSWLWSRSWVGDVAAGLRLALENGRAVGEVFNLCEPRCASVRPDPRRGRARGGARARTGRGLARRPRDHRSDRPALADDPGEGAGATRLAAAAGGGHRGALGQMAPRQPPGRTRPRLRR